MTENETSIQVGKWRVEPDAGQMSDGHNVVQVPPRLMRLLELLVEDAGNTVTREYLIEMLWPRGYVNEEALSRAVNELRGLLGDNARNPKFIRTIPKKGYRLIAGTDVVERADAPRQRMVYLVGVSGILVLFLLAFLLLKTPGDSRPVDLLSTAARLTSEPGLEWHPEISSSGEWVAQVVARGGQGAIQLFPTTTPEHTREITHPEGLYSPAFSPDSSQIATLSGRGDSCRILVWPVVGTNAGEEESVQQMGTCYRLTTLSGLDWSVDGKWLAFPTRDPASGATVISMLRLADGEILPLTRLSDPYQSDERPRFSPDGRWLSFSRGTRAVRELWMLDLENTGAAPRQLTRDGQFTTGHDWWPDSQSIIMDSDRSGHRALWRLDLGGKIELLGARDAQLPSIAADGTILFQDAHYEANIWKLDLATGELESEALISSTKYDSMPAWSPDGSEIAFSSNRTGDGGIWIAAADGSRVRRVYEPEDGRTVGPSWLNNGTALLATEYTPHAQRIIQIALNRREVVPLKTAGNHPYWPTESPDGNWIYYLASSEEGGSQLWRTEKGAPGNHELLINGPLNLYQVTRDGQVYYTRFREPGLWREYPGDEAGAELVIEDFPAWAGEDWTLHDGWIYHTAADGLYRQSLVDGRSEKVSEVFPYSLGPSIAVHPDGQFVLLTRTDRAESDLFLARPGSD